MRILQNRQKQNAPTNEILVIGLLEQHNLFICRRIESPMIL